MAVAAAVLSCAAAPVMYAQRIEPEARADAFIAHRSALQGALGLDIAFSPELHLELAAGAGPAFGGGAGASFGARPSARLALRAPRMNEAPTRTAQGRCV